MPTKKNPATPKKTSKKDPALRQLAQLRKTVKELRAKLERETRARQIETRVKTEAQKARAQLTSQISALRDQGRKLATNLKSALGDASKRDAARKQALAKITDLKAEYSKKTAGLRSELSRATAELGRKSEELKKLAGEAAHRAVEIIRSDESTAAPEPPMGGSSELAKDVSPQEIEDSADDEKPEEEQ
jgi:chromosome segregation ATPase